MNSTFTPLSFNASAPARSLGVAAHLARVGRAVWKAIESSSEARARRHMLDFASNCEGLQPELAKELRAASSPR